MNDRTEMNHETPTPTTWSKQSPEDRKAAAERAASKDEDIRHALSRIEFELGQVQMMQRTLFGALLLVAVGLVWLAIR